MSAAKQGEWAKCKTDCLVTRECHIALFAYGRQMRRAQTTQSPGTNVLLPFLRQQTHTR